VTQDQPLDPANGHDAAGAWSVDTRTWRVHWSAEARLIHEAPPSYTPTVWEALEFIDLADRSTLFSHGLACFLHARAFDLEVGLTTVHGRRRRVRLTADLSGGQADGRRTVRGTITAVPGQAAVQAPTRGGIADLVAALRAWELVGRAIPRQLRAPLATIRGLAQAVCDAGEPLAGTSRRHLERIAGAAAGMDRTLDALERFAPLSTQPLREEPVDLSALAHACLQPLREAEPHRMVQVRIEPRLQARGDPDLLRLALASLLENAWMYTRGVESPRIAFGQQLHRGQPVYAVRDNGIGFDMALAPRLFAPFERLQAQGRFEGAGMGLVVARRAIERHGGSLWAVSAPDQGASFLFTLR